MAGDDNLQVELERLRAENAPLKGRTTKGISLKVSEKGDVSVYGLGRGGLPRGPVFLPFTTAAKFPPISAGTPPARARPGPGAG